MRVLLFASLAMIPFTNLTWGDSVILKSGKIYEGTLLGATKTEVTLEVDRTKRRFEIAEIRFISFDRPASEGSRSRTTTPPSPIDQKYKTVGALLGQPAGEEEAISDGRGRYRIYDHGAIYFTPQVGAHTVAGPIREQWVSLGAERSELGYPTSDETTMPDGRRLAHFEHGAIIWSQQDGAMVEVSAH